MKKLFYTLLTLLLFASCKTTPKILFIQDSEYETKLKSYKVVTISKDTDFFRVYKLNDSDYAILPYKILLSESNIDELSSCLILTIEEAHDFKEGLQDFVEKCENNKTELFFAEVKLKESVIKITTSVESKELKPKTISSSSLVDTAFIIQAATRVFFGNKRLELTGVSKFSLTPFSLTLDDVKKLISALEK